MTNLSRSIRLVAALVVVLTAGTAHAATISFVASNPIASPDFFTEFAGLQFFDAAPKTLDGFIVAQPGGDTGSDIWTTFNPGGGDGNGWYPNGGDLGYTEIKLSSGADFASTSLFVGSGNGSHLYLAYELLNNGSSIQSGVLSGHSQAFHWLSITGGGYDTIRLRDGSSTSIAVGDGSHNALAFDKVSATVASVPDAGSTALLFATGLAGITGLGRRLRRS